MIMPGPEAAALRRHASVPLGGVEKMTCV